MKLIQKIKQLCGPGITYENGKEVIYLELLKALYVMLIVSLIFYKKLINDMEDIGFKLNPYYPCLSNKMLCDKQMTTTYQVDDLKVSRSEKYFLALSFNGPRKHTKI